MQTTASGFDFNDLKTGELVSFKDYGLHTTAQGRKRFSVDMRYQTIGKVQSLKRDSKRCNSSDRRHHTEKIKLEPEKGDIKC